MPQISDEELEQLKQDNKQLLYELSKTGLSLINLKEELAKLREAVKVLDDRLRLNCYCQPPTWQCEACSARTRAQEILK